jgi:hypothetical protein
VPQSACISQICIGRRASAGVHPPRALHHGAQIALLCDLYASR